jgi:hypothetical protein
MEIGNRMGSVMVSVLASSAIDCRYEPRSGQTTDDGRQVMAKAHIAFGKVS